MSRLTPAPEQIAATRPDCWNWVGANAGAGKTHVLTQRVARLLLAGADPQKILCLTYTKAAAAEMQTRLFRTLGRWAMAGEETLGQELAEITGGAVPPAGRLAEARRLFARALETPGGLKIQTIHAFCDALLRRFPLEASISPRFDVADDRQSQRMRLAVRAEMAEAAASGRDTAFDRAAATLNEGGIDDLARAVLARRGAFGTDIEPALAAQFGAEASADRDAIAREALSAVHWDTYAALRDVLLARGKSGDRPVGEALAMPAETRADDPEAAIHELMSRVLTKTFERRANRGFPSVDVKKARPSAEAELAALTDWALETRDRLLAHEIAGRTRDLHAFAGGLLGGLEAAKRARGLLDFDDLVTRAQALLTRSHMRQWVLYKLDQGIDHILVDEAQDTSPVQWTVIAAIADEFLAGEGARPGPALGRGPAADHGADPAMDSGANSGASPGPADIGGGRTIFVVGDEKQSIYSFQGAEPQAFGEMRDRFDRQLSDLGTALGRPALLTSYRSAPAILSFVDQVFLGREAELTASGGAVVHHAHRAADQGRVDLWPLVEGEDGEEDTDWSRPIDLPPPAHPKTRLAAAVAAEIARMIGQGARRPARAGAPGKPVRPGDILVLVTSRDRLARGIIRGLKQADIAVAGADRLSLTGELAVQDLLALIRVCLQPTDDLSLAALLRSPLCGLDEDALFDLSHGRQGTLWQALDAAPEHAETAAFLADMAAHADFERAYEFLERALIRHDGRRRLIARLGAEAEDPIDELLVQALMHESRATPSLAGFLAWLDSSEIEVKREMDRGVNAVRVMTVHGAKGLEAPVVVLPDTVFAGPRGGNRPVLLDLPATGNAPALTVWAGAKDRDDRRTRAAREAAQTREVAERARLLYVALTRAEDWLILCGADSKRRREDSWYPMLEGAMTALAEEGAVTEMPSPTGTGTALRYETGTAAVGTPAAPDDPAKPARDDTAPMPADAPADALFSGPLPDWLGPAPVETGIERASPSGLASKGAEATGGIGLGAETARLRGTAIHLLLERLATPPAGRPPDDAAHVWAASAEHLLARRMPELSADLRADAVAEAARVLAMPEAAWLFGPSSLAEVSVAIDAPTGGPRMIGRIDRLIPRPDRVLIVDIKTDARPATAPEDVPQAYLAQLGAYAAGIAPVWPERPVALAILWTAGPGLMEIAPDSAERALRTISFARTGRS